ncbi:MAG: hypothetical protein JWM36_1207 [Hyphomicrobiales bacterium]|nr:hypothetical protein [Hyphomicrobiales bacterium]
MMRWLILSVMASGCLAGGASAQGRPDTLQMSCGMAASLVSRAGAIVLGTGPNIYDRYVASRAFCQRDEEMRPRWLATRDAPQCFIGWVCERNYGGPGPR